MPAARPRVVSFASSTTSSLVLNLATETTGPKISSFMIFMLGLTSMKIVGWHTVVSRAHGHAKWCIYLNEVALLVLLRSIAAKMQCCSLLLAFFEVAHDLVVLNFTVVSAGLLCSTSEKSKAHAFNASVYAGKNFHRCLHGRISWFQRDRSGRSSYGCPRPTTPRLDRDRRPGR